MEKLSSCLALLAKRIFAQTVVNVSFVINVMAVFAVDVETLKTAQIVEKLFVVTVAPTVSAPVRMGFAAKTVTQITVSVIMMGATRHTAISVRMAKKTM